MLTRKDITLVHERMLQRFIDHIPKNIACFGLRTTSGTSSNAPLLTITHFPPQAFTRFEPYRAVVFFFSSMYLRLTRANQLRQHHDNQKALFIDSSDLTIPLETLLTEFAPDAVDGVPSWVARACERLAGKTFPGVQAVFLVGERLTAYAESLIRTIFLSFLALS